MQTHSKLRDTSGQARWCLSLIPALWVDHSIWGQPGLQNTGFQSIQSYSEKFCQGGGNNLEWRQDTWGTGMMTQPTTCCWSAGNSPAEWKTWYLFMSTGALQALMDRSRFRPNLVTVGCIHFRRWRGNRRGDPEWGHRPEGGEEDTQHLGFKHFW